MFDTWEEAVILVDKVFVPVPQRHVDAGKLAVFVVRDLGVGAHLHHFLVEVYLLFEFLVLRD